MIVFKDLVSILKLFSAFNDGIYVWLGCSSHQLQLLLKHTIDEIKKDEDKFGDIIELINNVYS